MVHSPYEVSSSYDDIESCEFHFGADFDVLINPEVIHTDKDLRRYSPERRDCYFKDEKTLEFFSVYTRKNCEFECLANAYLDRELMNCTPFYMVRDDFASVCDHRSEGYVQFYRFFFDQEFEGEPSSLKECKCLDQCDSIKYNIEVFEKKRSDYNKTLDLKQVGSDVTINFKFNGAEVIPMRRHQPVTIIEVLAQSGGMMGLFAGVSALSIIEVFYFFSLRIFSNFLRFIIRN